jgi:hypothetical protein
MTEPWCSVLGRHLSERNDVGFAPPPKKVVPIDEAEEQKNWKRTSEVLACLTYRQRLAPEINNPNFKLFLPASLG